MELRYIVLICVLFPTVFCFPGKSKDIDEEEREDRHAHFLMLMRMDIMESRRHIDGKIAELEDTVNVKLDFITEVVKGIERRQKFAEFCTEGICGENGTCALSKEEDTYECHCDEGYVGEHCEITGRCNIDLYNVKQEPIMPGREFPRCEEDGSYAGMQYIGSQAYCVTRENDKIDGYSVNRWETGDNMNCQCARDEYFRENEEVSFNCLPNGNYPKVACDLEWCWCQNWQGQEYGGRVPVGDLETELHC